MATFNGTPIPLGSVQTSYTDQMASAFAGQLVNESDINLTDSVLVDEADGIDCGLGVISAINASARRPGVNDTTISLPNGSETVADFAGVVIRPKSAFTATAGEAFIKDNWGAMLLSSARVGGRIWAVAYNGATAGAVPYWRIKADVTADSTTPVGGFSGTAISGTVAAVAATGTLTFGGNPADADTVTIASQTYRFKSTMAQANDVKLGANMAATLANLVAAVNLSGTEGVEYYTGTAAATTATAGVTGNVVTLTAVTAGTAGNSIIFTESSTAITISGAGTLTGGAAAVTTVDTVALTGKAKWNSSASAGGLAKIVIG